MASDDDAAKPGRRRSFFGVTPRIWALLVFVACLLLLTRSISQRARSATQDSRHRLLFQGGTGAPRNYLNVSEDAASPFEFCPVYGPGDDLANKYGALTLSKTRLHQGSGARVQRVIQKALLGLPVTFSVIGGSVSACHGAGDDPLSATCYPSLFLQWWNEVFPHPASEITNGALRRINSDYYGYCHPHHVPEITDMIIVELDIDDDEEALENFELLIRALLIRPDQPAVLILGHFSPQVHQAYGYVGPDHWHNVVAQFYDVPHISVKPVFYNEYMRDPTGLMHDYFADPKLANNAGHSVMADVLISYMRSQVCATWSGATGHSYDTLPLLAAEGVNVRQPTDARGLFGGAGQRKGGAADEDRRPGAKGGGDAPGAPGGSPLAAHLRVPPSRINTRPSDLEGRPFVEIAPFCASANDLINPLPSSTFTGTGWEPVHPPPGSSDLFVGAHYWEARVAGANFKIPVMLGAGDVGVYYMREPAATVGRGSSVECWVDDNVGGARTISNAADIGEPTPTLYIIDRGVSRGAHTVDCLLSGPEGGTVSAFRIMGVFAS